MPLFREDTLLPDIEKRDLAAVLQHRPQLSRCDGRCFGTCLAAERHGSSSAIVLRNHNPPRLARPRPHEDPNAHGPTCSGRFEGRIFAACLIIPTIIANCMA